MTMHHLRALALLAAVTAAGAARADEADDAKKAVAGLVKDLDAKKDIAKKAEAAAKEHDLDLVMASFKPRDKFGRGGLGAGKLGDGIEKALDKLGDKGITAADLKAKQKDVIELARVNQAIAEMTAHYGTARAKTPAQQKIWKKSTEDMKKASAALAKAAEGSDAAKVKAAALDLTASCVACHREFRPN